MRSSSNNLEVVLRNQNGTRKYELSHSCWNWEKLQALVEKYGAKSNNPNAPWVAHQMSLIMETMSLSVIQALEKGRWKIPTHPTTGEVLYDGHIYLWIGYRCKWLGSRWQTVMSNLKRLQREDPNWYQSYIREGVACSGQKPLLIVRSDEAYRIIETLSYPNEVDPKTGQIMIDGICWSGISKSAPWLNGRGKSICALVNERKITASAWYTEQVRENAGFLRGNGRWGNTIRLIRSDTLRVLLQSLPPKRVVRNRSNEPHP